MRRWLLRGMGLVAVLLLAAAAALWQLFGGGRPYPDLSGVPVLPEGTIEAVVTTDEPIGNAAVSAAGRIFFTAHPEARPTGPKLFEWVGGKAAPYPNADDQDKLFETPLGVAIDGRNQLWVIDPGGHGTGRPRLTAFDLASGKVAHQHDFGSEIAPVGSFLQDLQVSADGRWIYIADVGFWAKRPAIVVYDARSGTARRVLSRDPSVYPQNILIRNQIRDMSYFGGILEMKTGIDGVALSRDGRWLYYAAMNHDTLYRVPTAALQDSKLDDAALAGAIEPVGKKPLNDGLAIDGGNNVFITDVEHQAVLRMAPDGSLATIVKDARIRWADGLSFGPDGWLYLADSAIPHLVLQSRGHVAASAPYHIWRFKPGAPIAPQ